jgi:hypothetical protein
MNEQEKACKNQSISNWKINQFRAPHPKVRIEENTNQCALDYLNWEHHVLND